MADETKAVDIAAPQIDAPVTPDVQVDSSPKATPAVVNAEPTEQKFERQIPYDRFSQTQRERNSFRDELKKAQERNDQLMQMLQLMTPKPQSNVTFEQQEAARQLAEILANQPQFKSLQDKLAELESRSGEFSNSQLDSQIDREEEQLRSWWQQRGMDLEEIKPQIHEWLENNPLFSKESRFLPGHYTLASKALYAENYQEFAERAANLKLINEQQAKKKAGTETPGIGQGTPNSPKEKMEDFIARRGLELGVFGG